MTTFAPPAMPFPVSNTMPASRFVLLQLPTGFIGERHPGYVPILFDFDVPAERNITEAVTLLARMARFIIADLSEPSSIPKELEAIIPYVAMPVQPLLQGDRPYAMFKDYWKYDWVLRVHRYADLPSLLGTLANKVIAPAEAKMNDLAGKRQRFEAELIQPR